MYELVLSKATDCRPLRQAVLRPHLPPEASVYPGDDDDRTLHVTLKDGARVLGAVSVFHQPRAGLGSEVWRLRGMAVDPAFRRQGLGRTLLQAVQAVVEKRGGGLWARVRQEAAPFFEGHGFASVGEAQQDPDLGPQLLMTWHPEP